MPAADALAPWLADRLGVRLRGRTAVGGGCIHSAWCLRLEGGEPLFAKTNRPEALPLLQAEADGLRALAAAAAGLPLLLPEPLAIGVAGDRAVLVLSWLELSGSTGSAGGQGAVGSGGWAAFGAALADLHRRSLEGPPARFGWEHDNFIGSGVQPNGWCDDWGTFFVERRLRPQMRRLEASGTRLRGAEVLLERAGGWLSGHGALPALVHGDLWSGNAALTRQGSGALFDPAVHRADREVDLAMARLFGGFPAAFFRGHVERWPLPAGAAARVPLYNLYHLLNHANLFGGGYRRQAEAVIDDLLRDPPLGGPGR